MMVPTKNSQFSWRKFFVFSVRGTFLAVTVIWLLKTRVSTGIGSWPGRTTSAKADRVSSWVPLSRGITSQSQVLCPSLVISCRSSLMGAISKAVPDSRTFMKVLTGISSTTGTSPSEKPSVRFSTVSLIDILASTR